MKIVRIAVGVMLVVFAAALARADQVPLGDPIIKTGGGGTTAPLGPAGSAPAGIITLDFTISSPSGTSPGTSACILTQGTIMTTVPACFFENDITQSGSGVTIIALTFDAPTVDPSTVTCGFLTGSPFSECGVDPLTGGGTQITFNDGSILFHGDFTLDFESFPADTSFSVQGTGVPEPASLFLFASGLGALLARRRSRAR